MRTSLLALLAVVMAGCGAEAFESAPAGDAGAKTGREVLGFGLVQGECEACLGVALQGDGGACGPAYETCLADTECTQLLGCMERCGPERDGGDFNECMTSLCWNGSAQAAQDALRAVYECSCCQVATCRVECVATCDTLRGAAGPIYCP